MRFIVKERCYWTTLTEVAVVTDVSYREAPNCMSNPYSFVDIDMLLLFHNTFSCIIIHGCSVLWEYIFK